MDRIKILKYGTFVLGFLSVVQSMQFKLFFDEYLTYVSWLVNAILLYCLYKEKSYLDTPKVLRCWTVLILVNMVLGATRCSDYWDWRYFIQNIMAYYICFAALTFSYPEKVVAVFSFWFAHAWKYFIFLFPFLGEDGISKSMCPYMLLAIYYPLINRKYKLHVIVVLLVSVFLALGARTDILKLGFCLGLGWITQSSYFHSKLYAVSGSIRRILLILPFVFFGLAITGVFNVFRIQEEFGLESYTGKAGNDLMADTRTILYEEVILSVASHDRIIYGETPAKGYESAWFERNFDNDALGVSHYGWRGNTESSVLNIFMHFGVIGLLLYFFVFVSATYYGVYRSNNIYIPILALFVAFRWIIGWIEDFTNFDLNMLILWIMIGMCFSPYFRNMSNDEFKHWISKLTSV